MTEKIESLYSEWKKTNQMVDMLWREIYDSFTEGITDFSEIQEEFYKVQNEIEAAYRKADRELEDACLEFLLTRPAKDVLSEKEMKEFAEYYASVIKAGGDYLFL